MSQSRVYLIPCPIAEDALDTLSPAILEAVKKCQIFLLKTNVQRDGF